MGMSTHVIGFQPPNEKWRKMKAIYDACYDAGIDIPGEVDAFFNGKKPDENGVEVDIDNILEEWSDRSCRAGYQIELAKLPEGITILRFYNSY